MTREFLRKRRVKTHTRAPDKQQKWEKIAQSKKNCGSLWGRSLYFT